MTADYINPRLKLLGHIDRLAEIKEGKHPAPVNVEIDLSNRCNLKCKGCHMAYTHNGILMDTDLALSLMKELETFGVRSITWSGGGEPAMHPDIEKIIDACPIDQGIYTNGTLLSIPLIKLLKKKMKWVYISLDMNTRESWKEYKGVDLFGRVTAATQKLVEAEGDATIGVGYLLNETNWREFINMRDFALYKLGADYVQFRPLIILGASTDWIPEVLKHIELSNAVIMSADRFRMYHEWQGHGYKKCRWTQIQSIITPEGKLWTCCNRRYIGRPLGDVTQESFENIWARSAGFNVDKGCRVMCRGHIPNLTLNEIFGERRHGNFV